MRGDHDIGLDAADGSVPSRWSCDGLTMVVESDGDLFPTQPSSHHRARKDTYPLARQVARMELAGQLMQPEGGVLSDDYLSEHSKQVLPWPRKTFQLVSTCSAGCWAPLGGTGYSNSAPNSSSVSSACTSSQYFRVRGLYNLHGKVINQHSEYCS